MGVDARHALCPVLQACSKTTRRHAQYQYTLYVLPLVVFLTSRSRCLRRFEHCCCTCCAVDPGLLRAGCPANADFVHVDYIARGNLTLVLAGGATAPPDPPFKSASGLPETRPKTRPDHPGLSRDSDFRPENSKRTRPDQFRPTFGPWPKVPPGKKPTFAL